MEDHTFSVTELSLEIRDAVRDAFPRDVWVKGEVQGLTRSGLGHSYFQLVEKAGRARGYHKGGLARERERIVYTCMFTSPFAQPVPERELLQRRGEVTLPDDKEQALALSPRDRPR